MNGGLKGLLAQEIERSGPMPVDRFMALALGHPEWGYYRSRDPLGRGGDFTTAPEISQMFGELIGLWCACLWQTMNSPPLLRLVELGPGRGTLMADLLRAAGQAPGFREAASVHLVETSEPLRREQGKALEALGVMPQWHNRFDQVPDGPMILVANEFFDALPIRQLIKTDQGWGERAVALGDQGSFGFAAVPAPGAAVMVPAAMRDAGAGAIFEICPQGIAVADAIGRRLAQQGGAALIIDYGHTKRGLGDTLQAVKDHAYAPVLAAPGSADLTAHVDFEALCATAAEAGAEAYAALTQGEFLLRLGLAQRAEQLMNAGTEAQAAEIESQARRLIEADAMGELFKVAAWTEPGMRQPPGFEDREPERG